MAAKRAPADLPSWLTSIIKCRRRRLAQTWSLFKWLRGWAKRFSQWLMHDSMPVFCRTAFQIWVCFLFSVNYSLADLSNCCNAVRGLSSILPNHYGTNRRCLGVAQFSKSKKQSLNVTVLVNKPDASLYMWGPFWRTFQNSKSQSTFHCFPWFTCMCLLRFYPSDKMKI